MRAATFAVEMIARQRVGQMTVGLVLVEMLVVGQQVEKIDFHGLIPSRGLVLRHVAKRAWQRAVNCAALEDRHAECRPLRRVCWADSFCRLRWRKAADIQPPTSENRSVAQPGRAPRSGRGGRRFKSCRSDHSPSLWLYKPKLAAFSFPQTARRTAIAIEIRAAPPKISQCRREVRSPNRQWPAAP